MENSGYVLKFVTENYSKAIERFGPIKVGAVAIGTCIGILWYNPSILKAVYGIGKRKFTEYTGESLDVPETFKEKAESKSKKIVTEADKTVVGRCGKAMERVTAAGELEVECRITTYKDIEGEEKFSNIVTTLGEILHLPENQIKSIQLAATSRGMTDRILSFKDKSRSEGYMRLHTGFYEVVTEPADKSQNEKDKFTLNIAICYMDIKDIVFENIPDLKRHIEGSWEDDKGTSKPTPLTDATTEENGQRCSSKDWNTYLEHESHNSLLKYYD